jgi:hypothetical protein
MVEGSGRRATAEAVESDSEKEPAGGGMVHLVVRASGFGATVSESQRFQS